MDSDNENNVPTESESVVSNPEIPQPLTPAPVKVEQQAEVKKKRKFPWLQIIIILIIAFLGYDIATKVIANRNKLVVIEERVRPVKTELVKSISGSFDLQFSGTTRAIRQVDIGFNVNGTLNELPVKSGVTLEKGDLIGELDPRDYQNDLNAAIANYTNAQARLERVQKLYDAAVDPKSKLDEAIALFKVAEANLEIAQKARDDTVLKAPFKGIVAIRYVDNYQVVAQGQPVISLQDLETLEVEADIPEWLVAQGKAAETIEAYATYEALPGVKIPLRIKEFAAQASKSTRTYVVRFFMAKNPTDKEVTILPGMTANVVISVKPSGKNEKQFLLPVWAVNSNEGDNQESVFVVDDKSEPWVVNRRVITAGKLTDDSILVTGNLKDGERVVIAGASRLQDGMKVSDVPEFLKPNYSQEHSKVETKTEGSAFSSEVSE